MRRPRKRPSRCSIGSGIGCRGTGPWPQMAAADDATDGHSELLLMRIETSWGRAASRIQICV